MVLYYLYIVIGVQIEYTANKRAYDYLSQKVLYLKNRNKYFTIG